MELPFESTLDQQVEQLLREIEAAGVVIIDREVKKHWVKDLVSRGFSLQLISQTLKSYNFDFKSTSQYFASLYMGQQKAKEALTEVTAIRTQLDKEQAEKVLTAKVSWLISAFAASAVGFMTAIMVGNATEGIDTGALVGPANNMLTGFVKGGWIMGFVGLGIGILLSAFLIGQYLNKRVKKEELELGEKKTKEQEAQEKMKQQLTQLSAEITAAQKQTAPANYPPRGYQQQQRAQQPVLRPQSAQQIQQPVQQQPAQKPQPVQQVQQLNQQPMQRSQLNPQFLSKSQKPNQRPLGLP